MIKTINEFWGVVFRAFLLLDGYLLRAVDQIISLFAGRENFSMGRVNTGVKRGIVYLCLLSGITLIGMSCGGDKANDDLNEILQVAGQEDLDELERKRQEELERQEKEQRKRELEAEIENKVKIEVERLEKELGRKLTKKEIEEVREAIKQRIESERLLLKRPQLPESAAGLDLAYYADPFAFTGQSINSYKGEASRGTFDVRGHPGAAWPFGMTMMTPVNTRTNTYWSLHPDSGTKFFSYNASQRDVVKGFATSFITGPGCQIGQEFVFMADDVKTNDKLGTVLSLNRRKFKILFPYGTSNGTQPDTTKQYKNDKEKEFAEPGYYRVTYYKTNAARAIIAEFTVTSRTGLARFTFPSAATHATFHLSTHSGSLLRSSRIRSLSGVNNAISLELTQGDFCQQGDNNTVYAVFLFDRDIGSVSEKSSSSGGVEDNVEIALGANKIVNLKVGRSSISPQKAYENLIAENKTVESTLRSPVLNWEFDHFRENAYAKWNNYLKRIMVADGGKDHRLEEKRIFYSALYQAVLHPNIYEDHDGEYMGFDQRRHTVDLKYQDHQYQNYSGWDTYRGQHQLISMIDKKIARDIAQSLVNNANQAGCQSTGICNKTGLFTRWGHYNQDTLVMNGDPGTILVASSLAYGGENFNYDDAYKTMLRAGYGSIAHDVYSDNTAITKDGSDVSESKGTSKNITFGGGATKLRSFTRKVKRDGKFEDISSHANIINRTILPSKGETFLTDLHEFAASDFARAQFIKLVHSLKSDAIKDEGGGQLTTQKYQEKYTEIMNHAGDTWKKAYSWYRKRDSDIVVRDIAGRGTSRLRGSTPPLDPIIDDTLPNQASHPNSWNTYQKFKGLVDHYAIAQDMPFREGTAEHYRFMVPFDVVGLFKLLGNENIETGGFVQNAAQLQSLRNFIHGTDSYNSGEHGRNFNLGNQPCYSVPWTLNYTGYPHFTQMTIRRMHNMMYDDQPSYSMAGNDDLGSLSSQYVWASIGFYPAHPGLGILHVTTPRFESVTISDERGILLTSMAKSEGNSNKTCSDTKDYNHQCFLIDSMKYNGGNYTKAYLRYWKDIEKNSGSDKYLKLEFNLHKISGYSLGMINSDGNFIPRQIRNESARDIFLDAFRDSQPSTNWGRRITDLPPSGSGGILNAYGSAYPELSRDDHNQLGDFEFGHDNY